MEKIFYIMGIYSTCVFIHEGIKFGVEKEFRKNRHKNGKHITVEGFGVSDRTNSKEKVSNKLERIGF